MIYFSSLLTSIPAYVPVARRLFDALDAQGVEYRLLDGAKDIWLRDFMPVCTKSGKYVSFRYEPSYLADTPEIRTDFRRDLAMRFPMENLVYSDINLDGGNVVFSPSRETAVISDRVFSENPAYSQTALVRELERLLDARVIIIPSIPSDLTGHADGMVRFLDERTALGNSTLYKNGLEQRIARTLKANGIDTLDFPYFSSPKDSAVGCYLNFLETERAVFLPIFGVPEDERAITRANELFSKPVVPVQLNEIAEEGGCLNCISWERQATKSRVSSYAVLQWKRKI